MALMQMEFKSKTLKRTVSMNVILPIEKFMKALENADEDEKTFAFKGLCGRIDYPKGYHLFDDMKLPQIIKYSSMFSLN